jgi:hypothetical protein
MAKNKLAEIADKDATKVANENLSVSFEYLDWDSEEFFFHGMNKKYYQKFFNCLTTIKSSKEADIVQCKHPSLSPKSIFNTSTSIKSAFPDSVVNKIKNKLFVQTRDDEGSLSQAKEITSNAFEISLSKNYGRIHGFIWNNTFHIVWFDPAHNLYPMKQGITRHVDAAVVKCFSPDECLRLQAKIKELQEENAELYEAFAKS